MEIYLPIIQVKIDILFILFISFGVGVLSGLFARIKVVRVLGSLVFAGGFAQVSAVMTQSVILASNAFLLQ